jgi:antitoxin component of MazEF toxin-antitoxin module
MIKTLRRVGNSYGIVIDRPIMDLVGIKPDGEVEITPHEGGLLIRPVERARDHKSRVREAVTRMNAIHHKALKELAD